MPRIPITGMLPEIRKTRLNLSGYEGPHKDMGKIDVSPVLSGLRSIGEAGSAVVSWAEEYQKNEDRLAIMQARNEYNTMQEGLQNRIKENPGAYKEFPEWARETDQAWAEKQKEYIGRMSRKARNIFESEMIGIRENSILQRDGISIQAMTADRYKTFHTEYERMVENGDFEGCRKSLTEFRGSLISEQEAYRMESDIPRLQDSRYARLLADSTSIDSVERLQAKTDDGTYKEFSNMSDEYRRRLIRYAEQQEARSELTRMQEFNAALINGSNTETQAQLDADYADKKINARLYNAMSASLKSWEHEQQRTEKENLRQEKLLQDEMDKKKREEFKLNVRNFEFSSDPGENTVQRKNFQDSIQDLFPGNYKFQMEMSDYMEERSKMVGLKRKVFSTVEGEVCKKWLEENAKSSVFYYDPYGLFNKENNEDFIRSRALEASDLMAQYLADGKTSKEAIALVQEQITRMNEGRIYHLIRNGNPVKIKKGLYDSRDTSYTESDHSGFSGAWVKRSERKAAKNGALDKADIVEEKKTAEGRTLWKLKNGEVVYADEYDEAKR